MKGRVAVLKEYLKPLEIQEYEVPDPETGAIVVRITHAGICGSDMHTWRGDQMSRPLPASGRPMGHEGVGVVHSLGKGVDKDFSGETLKEGDRVVFASVFSCGRCLQCLNGNHNLCSKWRLNYGTTAGQYPYFVNTYSDYYYLPMNHPIFKVPSQLKDEEVVSLNCAMGTVMQGLELANISRGQTVVVQGAGGLGLYAIALAKDMGAECVIAIDGQQPRLSLAKELGADEIININEVGSPKERVGLVMEATHNKGADIVLELAGLGEIVQEGLDMLGTRGTYLEIGNIMRGRTAIIEPSSLMRKRIIGTTMYRPALIPVMLDFLVRNHEILPLSKIISHKYRLADINNAFVQAEWHGRKTDVIRAAVVP